MSRLKTILVGEDHADTASMLERLFESEHYAVRIAPDLDTCSARSTPKTSTH